MRFYSPEWVAAFNLAAAGSADPPEPATDALDFRLLQLVHDGPDGTLRIGLVSADGRLTMTLDPPEGLAPQVTLSVTYEDAAALSRGETDPARLVATGRVKVRGELSVLLGGQAMLAAVAARVATLSAVTDY